ncbi:hypothetical protein CFC21_044828 [Triticum aestivum]|uniref:rRNA N-glycosidase n=2 Tax=Triticum aestivum TaxID=4565 RepID=A0A3B6G2L7_WHEAT|nr:uncharacterized protein LOC119282657 [Triticum dicoccoides]XP_044345853.1 uncharacterized protein LOC123066941 [Triticum aestivum]KAF7033754.1 hypothetical protein CFC21_044828 [Triticum aestivum]
MHRSFQFGMAAFHLLFLFLVLALSFSGNSAVAAVVDDQPRPQQEVCMASSSSSCPEAAVDAKVLKGEASVMYKEKASSFFRHDGRTIKVDFVLPASNSEVAAGDEDLQLRQEAMAQAITVLSRYSPETTDEQTLKRAMGVVNLEAQRWKPIFRAVGRVLESGADDRTKEDAFAQARVQLNRDLGQEGPNALKLDFGYM